LTDFLEAMKAVAPNTGALRWHHGLMPGDELWDANTGWNTKNLRKRGRFSPATLIDVGVGAGTGGLYEAFPEAHLVLIEPLEEFKPDLDRIVSEHGGEYLITAAGAREGSATLNVEPHRLQLSSILESNMPRDWADKPMEVREIPITTLDGLCEQKGWRSPYGLKIDTEGYEYEIIRGATRLLRETQFVIAELHLFGSFENGYCFADFIALMQSHGFHLCDVLDGRKMRYRDVIYIDAMFQRTQ
jgi:FkbM family methyltransferase